MESVEVTLLGGVPVIVSAAAIFILGAAIGSFLNVVALRYNTGRSLSGRSSCAACAHTLRWYELIPIFSYFALRGRCRTCGTALSLQYPAVEFLTAALLAGLCLVTSNPFEFIFFAVIFCIFVVIGVYDLKHLIVPNGLSYAAALLAFGALFLNFQTLTTVIPTQLELLSGVLAAFPIFLLWFFSRGRWMGMGDAKLMLSIGWLLGPLSSIAAFFIAAWAGALVGVGYLLISRIRERSRTGTRPLRGAPEAPTMKSEIPFAPFLLFGFFVIFFAGPFLIPLILWNL